MIIFLQISHYKLPTPLSGRSYTLPTDQFCPVTPVSSAAQIAFKLSALLDEPESRDSELDNLFG